ncbi:MAG: murein biosynthesis integral membrane protein MurJ [bacterium]
MTSSADALAPDAEWGPAALYRAGGSWNGEALDGGGAPGAADPPPGETNREPAGAGGPEAPAAPSVAALGRPGEIVLGGPGQAGGMGGEPAWGSTTYVGPRRHRPGREPRPGRRSGPTRSPHAEPPAKAADTMDAPGAVAEPSEDPASADRGLLRSSRTMAIASLASRFTGFLRSIALAAALGITASRVADSYNLANILPNMVYELLLGGVLSSVVIPLIVTAQEHDRDRGEAYTQRLLSWSAVVLGVATLLAVAAAPLLAAAFAHPGAQRELISIFATLLLPEIFFYGLGAMFAAVLNTRGVYGPPAWAPVLNNVITIATVVVFGFVHGPATLTEATITNTQILVLGIGTTVGIVVQALVLVPFLHRTGFHWHWRFRPSTVETVRMSEVRTLAAWVLAYVAVSQVGVFVVNRVANNYAGGPTTFTYADLLFQVPYGVVGVSLLTALMPRMSRSAARGDSAGVVTDLSLGARLSAVGLLPFTGGLIVLGPTLTTVLFSYGRSDAVDSRFIGVALALGAFGLLPFAVVMLQLRVFYATRDARTPALINVFMVAAKIAIVLGAQMVLHSRGVILWLSVATSTSYLVGALVGHVLLTRRFGRLGFSAVGRTVVRVGSATAGAAAAALGVVVLVGSVFGRGPGGSAIALVSASILGVAALVVLMRLVRVAEVPQIMAALGRSG